MLKLTAWEWRGQLSSWSDQEKDRFYEDWGEYFSWGKIIWKWGSFWYYGGWGKIKLEGVPWSCLKFG